MSELTDVKPDHDQLLSVVVYEGRRKILRRGFPSGFLWSMRFCDSRGRRWRFARKKNEIITFSVCTVSLSLVNEATQSGL